MWNIVWTHHNKTYLSLQDFCHGQVMWPPLSALQVKIAEPGKSCKQVCQESQLICEPSFFQHLNKDKALLRWVFIAQICCLVSLLHWFLPQLEFKAQVLWEGKVGRAAVAAASCECFVECGECWKHPARSTGDQTPSVTIVLSRELWSLVHWRCWCRCVKFTSCALRKGMLLLGAVSLEMCLCSFQNENKVLKARLPQMAARESAF